MSWIEQYQRLAAATPERGQTPRQHFDEWLARAWRLGDLRKAECYTLEMLFEIQQMLVEKPKARAVGDLSVSKDKYGNLWARRGEENVAVWYSYGRVYTVLNREEMNPTPEDAQTISLAFLAIAEYLEAEATQ